MELQSLIEWLEKMNQEHPDGIVPCGFDEPNSWRGNYEDLAFKPKENAKISDMLKHAKHSMGSTFIGWKGGEFEMNEHTKCWIAKEGVFSNSDCIGTTLLKMWELSLTKPL
jgi:hypothetical protein